MSDIEKIYEALDSINADIFLIENTLNNFVETGDYTNEDVVEVNAMRFKAIAIKIFLEKNIEMHNNYAMLNVGSYSETESSFCEYLD